MQLFNEMLGVKSYCEKLVLDLRTDLEKPIFKSNYNYAKELNQILDDVKRDCGIH